jgi:hypothetical protein
MKRGLFVLSVFPDENFHSQIESAVFNGPIGLKPDYIGFLIMI